MAAQVGSLVDISRTGATAGSNTASSEASVIRITEHPLFGLGGSQQGDGQTGGALVDTQGSLPARVQVAPWAASAGGTGTATRHARSSAAVARADVPDVAQAGVLTSDSEATHTDAASSGTAVTEALRLGLLDAIDLVLLHSEVASNGRGHSYLVGLNGTQIGTDEQLGASPLCALNAPGLLSLSCLTASGGNGAAPAPGSAGDAAAQVAEITPALSALSLLDPVAAFTSAASSGTGSVAAAAPPTEIATQGAEASRATAPAAAAAGGSGLLPRTGTAIASLMASAVMLLLSGWALRRFRVRPATVVSR